MKQKATIIIPVFNLVDERLRNFNRIIENLVNVNIPLIISLQVKNEDELDYFTTILDYLDPDQKITLMYEIVDSDFIHKSLLINKAAEIVNTKYIWVLDADVFLDYKKIYECIDDQDVIKPFKKVIRLTEEETVEFIENGSIKFKKGTIENVTKIFGPLSFIVKKSVFDKENMNEKFKGWGWEDLEFASRIMERYNITEINVYGLHLFHPRDTSNEKENRIIFNSECKGSEVYKKSSIEDMNKSLESDDNGVISQVETKPNTDITVPLHIQHQSKYVQENELEFMDFDWSDTTGCGLSLEDCSIVIPVRIDTPDRLHNLKIVLNYFNDYFNSFELIVLEHDPSPKLKELVEGFEGFRFKWINRQALGSFHKTFNFNLAISIAKGKYIAAYDCDSIFNPLAVYNAFQRLKNNNTNFIFPYNRYMVQVKRHVFKGIDKLDSDFIKSIPTVTTGVLKDTSDYEVLYGSHDYECTGGAFFFNKEAFFMNGGYNPNIISYGCEDNEIELRIKRLGNTIERLDSFNCYHLEHGRSVDSHYNNFFPNNEREYAKIRDLPEDELRSYVENGFKHTFFDTKKDLNIVNNKNEYSIKLDDISEKFDLSDVDIIIPTFIDFHDRVRNLEAVLNQLEHFYCNYNVILIELESIKAKYLYHKVGIQYHNYQEKFNKTRAINLALEKCTRQFVCVWDVDALIPSRGIEDAMEALRQGNHKIAYPYNGWFLDIDNGLRDKISKTLDFSELPLFDNNNNDYEIENLEVRFSTRHKFKGGGNNGGCVFMERETLNSLGNYNENFYQWGYEDDEIEQRFEIMGYPRYNSPNANCFHMVHRRVEEASIRGEEFFKINHREFDRVTSMNKETLGEYIKNDFHLSYDKFSVICDGDDTLIKHYLNFKNIHSIIIPTECETKIEDNRIHYSNDPDSSRTQLLLFANNKIYTEDQIEEAKKLFREIRRLVVVDDGDFVLLRKDFYPIIKDKNYNEINVVELEKASNNKKASIILTTYGGETLSSSEYLKRFYDWKDSNYELIVVVHDETPEHRAILEFYKSINIIDKLIYAETNHGHIRGLSLGVSKSSSDIVIIANNDVRISKRIVDDCIEEHKDPQLGVIGWHYNDFPNHEGTFWDGETLKWTPRKGKVSKLLPEEIENIKEAEWYTGKTLEASKNKRLLLCNGSFFSCKKHIWEKIGGFNPDKFKHYFSDDYFCYGVLDLGYNIKNLPKEYRCSQNPEIFESLSDLEFKGKENPFKGKNFYTTKRDSSKDSQVFEFVYDSLNHPKVCLIGSKPTDIYNLPIDYCSNTNMNEKVDIMVITEPVSDHRIARNILNDGGWIFCISRFADGEYQKIDKYSVYTKIPSREQFKLHEFNKEKNKNIEFNKGSIKKKETSKTKFVMLTQPRVGFTCMKTLFDKHNQIYLDQAIFGSDNMSLVARGISGNKFSDPEGFINSFFDLSAIETTKNILGFRFKAWDEPIDFVSKHLVNMEDISKIIITRENLLKAVVDCAFAHETEIWHTTTDICSYPDIEVDIEWARGWMVECKNIANSWRESFDINGVDYLNVTYEEIFYGKKKGLDKIYNHIGAKKFKMPYPLKPTFNEEAINHIKNKDELNNLFGKEFGYLE